MSGITTRSEVWIAAKGDLKIVVAGLLAKSNLLASNL
jgi:hypothetical protein